MRCFSSREYHVIISVNDVTTKRGRIDVGLQWMFPSVRIMRFLTGRHWEITNRIELHLCHITSSQAHTWGMVTAGVQVWHHVKRRSVITPSIASIIRVTQYFSQSECHTISVFPSDFPASFNIFLLTEDFKYIVLHWGLLQAFTSLIEISYHTVNEENTIPGMPPRDTPPLQDSLQQEIPLLILCRDSRM